MKHVKNLTVAKASTNDGGGGLGSLGLVSYVWGIAFFLKEWF